MPTRRRQAISGPTPATRAWWPSVKGNCAESSIRTLPTPWRRPTSGRASPRLVGARRSLRAAASATRRRRAPSRSTTEIAVRETYYRSADLHVYGVRPFATDRVVITFAPASFPAGLDQPGFGEAFLRKYRIDAVHVVPRSNAWYQYPDLPDALE